MDEDENLEPDDTLLSEGPGDDRTDSALKARADTYSQGDALNWLLEGSGTDAPKPETRPTKPAQEAPTSTLRSTVEGAAELPRQAVGGIRDAAQSVLDFGTYMESIAPLGKVPFPFANEEGAPRLPEVGAPKGPVGGAVRAISRFIGPFGLASKAIGGLKGLTALGTLARASGAGAVADFFAFGGHEERLSDLIEEFPALKNPVTKYLKSDKDDSEAEGRVKNAVEGLGVGTLADGLLRGLKVYRSWRIASKDADPAETAAEIVRTARDEQLLREAGETKILGSAEDPLLASSQKIKDALAETGDLGVPDDVVAKALTSRGLEPLQGADGVYVNFSRINEPEDIQRIIQDTASSFSSEIDKARRGVVTNQETLLSADKIDAWDTLRNRRRGAPLGAAETVAARQLWSTAADKLGQVANLATENPTPENLFQFRRMLATYHAIQKEVIGARSETARALQSWSIPVGGNLERMRDIDMALAQTGGEEAARALATRVAVLSRTPGAAGGLSKFVEKSVGAKSLGVIQEYWINALLSGPKTHMVNMMSNTGVMGLSVLERSLAGRYGRLFQEEGVEVGEALAQLQGLRGGVLDAFRNAGKALRTGQTGYGVNKIDMPRERMISSGTWNVRSDSWLGQGIDGIGAVTNTPGRLLQAEDEFFKTMGYRMELHAQAQRMVTRELREGKITKADAKQRYADILDDPPEAIRLEATASAAYQTFTQAPGPWTQWILRSPLMTRYPVGRFILPFVNTPGNILNYTFERTPLAMVTSKYRNAIAKGGAEADLARTRMAMGTMAMMYATDLAMNGNVTGSGPPSGPERDRWLRQGNKPYSVRLGDRYFAINRLDPMGYHLGIAADLAEYVRNADPTEDTQANFERAFAAATFAVAENVTSKSYMSGLASFGEAVNEPDRYAYYWMRRYAKSFIPAGVKEVAKFQDPVMRATSDITSELKSGIPFMSDGLPAKRDLWGRQLSYESGLGPVYDALSPIYSSQYKPEPIDRAMEENDIAKGMPSRVMSIKGEKVSLKDRPDIYYRYVELSGGTKPSAMGDDGLIDRYGDKTLLETLNEMVEGKNYLSDEWNEAENRDDKEELVNKVVNQYRRAARKKLLEEYPWITERAVEKKAAKGLQGEGLVME